MMSDILVVDDEPLQRGIISTILSEEGYRVYEAGSGREALDLAGKVSPTLILTDLKMPDISGIELLEKVKALPLQPQPSVLIMTAFGTIASAVDAIKKGAFDYLTKPLDKDALILKVHQAIEREELRRENINLKDALYERFRIDGIIGHSERMKKVIETLRKVAPTGATVLITGESGTGKELIARALHYNSPVRRPHLLQSTVLPYLKTSLRVNSLAMNRAPLQGQLHGRRGLLSRQTGERFSLMR